MRILLLLSLLLSSLAHAGTDHLKCFDQKNNSSIYLSIKDSFFGDTVYCFEDEKRKVSPINIVNSELVDMYDDTAMVMKVAERGNVVYTVEIPSMNELEDTGVSDLMLTIEASRGFSSHITTDDFGEMGQQYMVSCEKISKAPNDEMKDCLN